MGPVARPALGSQGLGSGPLSPLRAGPSLPGRDVPFLSPLWCPELGLQFDHTVKQIPGPSQVPRKKKSPLSLYIISAEMLLFLQTLCMLLFLSARMGSRTVSPFPVDYVTKHQRGGGTKRKGLESADGCLGVSTAGE